MGFTILCSRRGSSSGSSLGFNTWNLRKKNEKKIYSHPPKCLSVTACKTSWPCKQGKNRDLIPKQERSSGGQQTGNKCDKRWRWIAKKLWLFRKRKASTRHNNVDTSLKIFWAEKNPLIDSLWWRMPPFVSILAIFPFSLNPSFFPPLPSARQQFIYIIVYADSFLPPRRTHNDLSCWCYPLFAGFSSLE